MTWSRRPLLTIGMPVRNEANFLEEAVESLLDQDFRDFVLIISDNASKDDTEAIGRDLMRRDSRIRYLRSEQDVGAIGNFNRVAHQCETPFFMWAGGHDRWLPSMLSSCIEALLEDSSLVLAAPKTLLVGLDGSVAGVMPGPPDTRGQGLLRRFWAATIAVPNGNPIYGIIRTEALAQTRLARPVISADMIILSQLAVLGGFARIDRALWCRREGRGGESAMELVRRQIGALFPSEPGYGVLGAYLRLLRDHLGALGSVTNGPLTHAVLALIVILRYAVVVPWRWLVKRTGSVRLAEVNATTR